MTRNYSVGLATARCLCDQPPLSPMRYHIYLLLICLSHAKGTARASFVFLFFSAPSTLANDLHLGMYCESGIGRENIIVWQGALSQQSVQTDQIVPERDGNIPAGLFLIIASIMRISHVIRAVRSYRSRLHLIDINQDTSDAASPYDSSTTPSKHTA